MPLKSTPCARSSSMTIMRDFKPTPRQKACFDGQRRDRTSIDRGLFRFSGTGCSTLAAFGHEQHGTGWNWILAGPGHRQLSGAGVGYHDAVRRLWIERTGGKSQSISNALANRDLRRRFDRSSSHVGDSVSNASAVGSERAIQRNIRSMFGSFRSSENVLAAPSCSTLGPLGR